MRAILVAFLLLMTLLAGCAQETESPDAADPVGGGTTDATGNQTVNETVEAVAPVAMLTAAVLNGTAPLVVDFTIEAENGTSWFLDLGDGNATDGDVFPAVVNHTFGPGAFNVTLTVRGDGGNATDTVLIEVMDAAMEEAAGLQPFEETVEMTSICPGCKVGTSTCAWRQSGGAAPRDCAWIDFGPDYEGMPFTLTGTGLDPDGLFWNNGCGNEVGERFSNDLTEESGFIPKGATCILVWEAFDPLVDVTFRIDVV